MTNGELILQTEVANFPGGKIVQCRGEIDMSVSEQFYDAIASAMEDGGPITVVDLSEVHYLDSAGVSSIIRALSYAGGNNIEIRLVCSRPILLKVFGILKFEQIVKIYRTVEEAIA